MFLFRINIALFLMAFASFNTLATSLYDESKFKALYEDKKAFSVGDGITVLIYENTQATSSAGEGSRGDISFSGGAFVDKKNWDTGLKVGSSDSGDAATNRKGFVSAQLTAVVTGKDDGGALLVEGHQKITINEEEQVIQVKGRIRPEDISNQNTVPSFRIQNAEISIEGEGKVTNGKDGNLIVQLFRWMGF